MTWNLNYSNKIEWFLELEADGQHVEALHQQPVLYDDLVFYYRAFIELSGTRISTGFGISPIQFSEIESYLRIYGYTDNYRFVRDFVRNIKILDNVYIKYAREKESG